MLALLLLVIVAFAARCAHSTPFGDKTCPYADAENVWENLQRGAHTAGHVPVSCLPKKTRRSCRTVGKKWDNFSVKKCRISQAHVVEGYFVVVYDDCVPKEFTDMLFMKFRSSSGYQGTQSDNPETAEYSYYKEQHDIDGVMKSGLGRALVHLARGLVSCDFSASAVYTNAIQFGDSMFVHTDATGLTPNIETHQFITALVYSNPKWKADWGGETVFVSGQALDEKTGRLNENGDVLASVNPKPGRIVLFDSRVRHSARPPEKTFIGRRYTTAFKLSCLPSRPLLLPSNTTYYALAAEARKERLTRVGRVPGHMAPRFDMRESRDMDEL